jgi:V/A-type H+-transporting ATPase subunit I
MNVPMALVNIVGLKRDLQIALLALRRLGCMHIEALSETPEISARPLTVDRESLRLQEELSFLAARIDGLRNVLGGGGGAEGFTPGEDYIDAARAGVETLMPRVQALSARREKLEAELASLPGYEATLRKLLPIIPPSARDPANISIGVLVNRAHVGVLDSVARSMLDLTSGRGEVVASDVDNTTRAMLLVFPQEFAGAVEGLLGSEDVSRLRLPAELGEGPPDAVLATLRRRMGAIPEELKTINQELSGLAAQWQERLTAWSARLHDEIEACQVLPSFGETDQTFVLAGWVPEKEIGRLKSALQAAVGEAIFVQQLPLTPEMQSRAPVMLQNPRVARPFESLVSLLALPRYGHLDPTRLMAFFLPIFFGMILGDVGYGVLLLALSLFMLRKMQGGVVRDVLTVLAMGSSWAILFGFLYGEAFGTLGESLGMHALWFDRASSEHVSALLMMTLVVGAVHLTLGLILGVWEAYKDRSRNHLLERGGMLLGLIALFVMVGVLAKVLPDGFMTPAIAGLILGIVMLGASLGWLGVIMGPIEFIGLVGNLLSYLRIAAIGLASVYLAKVANDVAGMVGNVICGAIVAVLIHALNLVLGAFSPTIHSLRLHYVEFFRKFYEGGGKPYRPFKSNLEPGGGSGLPAGR